MPEVLLPFPRAFVEFVDPADGDTIYRCDLSWLTSRWTCIFGSGCQGIYADRPDDGCCTLGAHFADKADESRVRKAAKQLTADQWQYRSAARRDGWVELEGPETVTEGEKPARKTKVVDGACIFLNRPGFAAGSGCALHLLALQQDRPITETKPDVCWQLPIRRQFRTVTRTDETSYTEVSIGEYGRDGWGPGGHDLDWYCTANTEAHVGRRPVYESSRDELIALMGLPAYAVLVDLCRDFGRGAVASMRHPADPRPESPILLNENGRMQLDHLSFAAGPDGARETAARLGRLLGAEFEDGGFHPRFGTRNLTLALSNGRYLEVVEVLDHPAADKAAFGQAVRARSADGGGWLGWVVAVDDLDPVERRLGRPPIKGHRYLPDGTLLEWQQLGVRGLQADPQLPFFVNWLSGAGSHPSVGGGDIALLRIEIAGDPDRVDDWLGGRSRDVLSDIDIDWVAPNGQPGLIAATFGTTNGVVRF